MDQTELVTAGRAAGHALVERLKGTGFPVTAAFWFWEEELREESLVIVTPLANESSREAYTRIAAVLQQHPEIAPLYFLARTRVVSPALLREWLARGSGPFGGTRADIRFPWIEGERADPWPAH